MNQNIFELLREKYRLPKKVKLFEAFSGIGCQRMGFEKANINYEVVGVSEIDKYALQSYQAMFGECPNFGSITDIKGTNLPQVDVFTYSFPCTDLSKAGHKKGMTKDTRSGLVYEVLRILHECTDNKPKVLIMENVVDLVQVKFIRQFQEIQLELEQLGYTNYTQTMNAKDYGVAQNRDRVFMVSILGDYYYEFPKPIKLEKKLKDYLEDEVDLKYYLTDKQVEAYQNSSFNSMQRDNDINGVCQTIDTMQGGQREPKITVDFVIGSKQKNAYVGTTEDSCSSLTSAMGMGGGHTPMVTEESFMKIRKLTPLECWRLMGIDDSYFYKASQVCSNSQLYKQAGNGIVIDVFASIVKNMQKGELNG